MDRRRPLALAAAAITATVLFAACGDDDSTTTTTTVVATSGTSATSGSSGSSGSTAATIGNEETGSQQDYIDAAAAEIQFTDEDMRGCVAQAVVSDDVYAAIQKAGMSIVDFKTGDKLAELKVTEPQAASVADNMAACGDLLPQVLDSSDEQLLSCAKEKINNVQVAQVLSYSLFGITVPEDIESANQAVGDCIKGAATSTTA